MSKVCVSRMKEEEDKCRICGKSAWARICAECYNRTYGFREDGKAK